LRLLSVILITLNFGFTFSFASQKNSTKRTKEVQIVTGKIVDIKVLGLKKVDPEAILGKLKLKVNDQFSADTESFIAKDIKTVFAMGLFDDISVEKEVLPQGIVLKYNITEKPSITEIVYEGNSDIKKEDLEEASGIKAFEIVNASKIQDAVEKLQKFYEEKGFFLAKIESRVEAIVPNESSRLVFNIVENEKVKVKKISFIGNKQLKDGFLKDRMAIREMGFFSGLSGSGAYKQDAFDRDVQLLKFLYFNEGFLQVRIDRPQVTVTPDKKSIYITFRIEEGQKYDVGDVDFSGDLLFTNSELSDSIEINKTKVFSYEIMQKDLQALQAKYGDLGYAYANVIPKTNIKEAERKVDITFEFDKGNKVYLGKINVIGNSKTRDKVVRRELKIFEGELYNETRRRDSVERVQRLGFFDEVNFKTSADPENPDIMNIDINVKERNTGQIQLGAGYSSSSGFNLNGSVKQTNFLGKGQNLGAGLNISGSESFYNLNFTDPYFNDTLWSVGYDLYQSYSPRTEYTEKKLGGAIRFGHPIAEDLNLFARYKLDRTDLDPVVVNGVEKTDRALFPIQTASGITSSITGTVEYDKRNDRFSPSKGIFASASLEYAGIGGQIKYTRSTNTFRYFKKLFWEVIWRNNINYSSIASNDGVSDPPFNELFLLGGPYSLRGYRFSTVGKTRFSDKLFNDADIVARYPNVDERREFANRPFGGTKQLIYQTELEFPVIAEAGIKGVFFYDVGQAEDQLSMNQFYSDVGFGFRWFSPIGPLRFEWGIPLRKYDKSPEPVSFEFSIGTPF